MSVAEYAIETTDLTKVYGKHVRAVDQPGGTPGVTDVVSGAQAVVVLIAYVVGAALLAALTLQRQDYPVDR